MNSKHTSSLVRAPSVMRQPWQVFLDFRDKTPHHSYLDFGARCEVHEAVAAATCECLQRLGFLWGEAIPQDLPAFAPTPDLHQEYYLHPPHQIQCGIGCMVTTLSSLVFWRMDA